MTRKEAYEIGQRLLANVMVTGEQTDITEQTFAEFLNVALETLEERIKQDEADAMCDCYSTRVETHIAYYNPRTGEPIYADVEVGFCRGTKEQEYCSCDGKKAKCNFYKLV